MNVEYTGSQEEAREASEAALQNELAARAATPQLSTIRDHTGSGVGNDPDENRRRARVSRVPGPDTTHSWKWIHACKPGSMLIQTLHTVIVGVPASARCSHKMLNHCVWQRCCRAQRISPRCWNVGEEVWAARRRYRVVVFPDCRSGGRRRGIPGTPTR